MKCFEKSQDYLDSMKNLNDKNNINEHNKADDADNKIEMEYDPMEDF